MYVLLSISITLDYEKNQNLLFHFNLLSNICFHYQIYISLDKNNFDPTVHVIVKFYHLKNNSTFLDIPIWIFLSDLCKIAAVFFKGDSKL